MSLKTFWESIKPANIKRNRKLIDEYWEKDRLRKISESKITKHSNDYMVDVSIKIDKKLKEMNATDLMIISEKVEAPKLTFKIDGVRYTTDEIFDFTYEKIMLNIKNTLKNS